MQFKTEVSLLLLAITVFAVAMFFYSYQSSAGENASLSLSYAYPCREIALAFVGFGSVSMVTASISYSKKTKNIMG
jgi:flagellar basal body-associated protein FliL